MVSTNRRSENDHQKAVQGKNQRGPDDKIGRDVGGGNDGSKGQNMRRLQPGDIGDERGHGGSGGGQGNRQNKAVNQSGPGGQYRGARK
jgi:hypothetical protein